MWWRSGQKSQSKQDLGLWGEEQAWRHYKKLGYKLLAQRYTNKTGKQFGEIDLIVCDQTTIIFVEVKTRTLSDKFGSGAEAVSPSKQKKLVDMVNYFLLRNPKLQNLRPQIDVCVVNGLGLNLDNSAGNVTIISNAVSRNDG